MGLVARLSRLLARTPLHGPARWTFRALFRREEFKAHRRLMALYRRFVRRGQLCFDVGANYGSRTEALLALGAVVVAIEPQAFIAEDLKRRFERNSRLTVAACALGPGEGTATMYACDLHLLTSLSREWVEVSRNTPHLRHATWREVTVPVTTLDALIRRHGTPVFAKIDAEGFDSQILKGLSTTIPVLCFEMTPRWPQGALDCLREIARLGPAEYNISRAETLTLAFDPWLTHAQIEKFCREELPREPAYGDIYVRFLPVPGRPP
jgi:FkbM family methyltransferase